MPLNPIKLIIKRYSGLQHCATTLGERIISKPPLMPEITRQKIYQDSEKLENAQLSRLIVPAKAAPNMNFDMFGF